MQARQSDGVGSGGVASFCSRTRTRAGKKEGPVCHLRACRVRVPGSSHRVRACVRSASGARATAPRYRIARRLGKGKGGEIPRPLSVSVCVLLPFHLTRSPHIKSTSNSPIHQRSHPPPPPPPTRDDSARASERKKERGPSFLPPPPPRPAARSIPRSHTHRRPPPSRQYSVPYELAGCGFTSVWGLLRWVSSWAETRLDQT
ncbi:hypothetical protein ZWY2020_015306 [Hordeum vulgare]|nr:hypothetical protein ZWY2020_015306 [Hordeum vulgare]